MRTLSMRAVFRTFLIALFAIMHAFFALAQKLRKRKKGPAFQASSPKNFQRVGLRTGPLFLPASSGLTPFLAPVV
jgi:hypothetical protein